MKNERTAYQQLPAALRGLVDAAVAGLTVPQRYASAKEELAAHALELYQSYCELGKPDAEQLVLNELGDTAAVAVQMAQEEKRDPDAARRKRLVGGLVLLVLAVVLLRTPVRILVLGWTAVSYEGADWAPFMTVLQPIAGVLRAYPLRSLGGFVSLCLGVMQLLSLRKGGKAGETEKTPLAK